MSNKNVWLCLAALLLAACQNETGILVAVSGQAVEELEFQVAVEREGRYVLDHGVSGERYAVKGRNLNARPFELLLHEEDTTAPALNVIVAALGLKEGEVAAFDITAPPQPFIDEEVVRRSLQLRETSDANAFERVGEGCFLIWRLGGESSQSWLLASSSEADCGPEQSVTPLKVSCTVERTASGLCFSKYQLRPPVTASSCSWEILEAGGFTLRFGNGSTTVNVCEPWLKLEAGPESGTIELKFYRDGSSTPVIFKIEVKASDVEACTASAVQCQ